MAIAPKCDIAKDGKELTDYGAILLSPPDKNGMVRKWHICAQDYQEIVRTLLTPAPSTEQPELL